VTVLYQISKGLQNQLELFHLKVSCSYQSTNVLTLFVSFPPNGNILIKWPKMIPSLYYTLRLAATASAVHNVAAANEKIIIILKTQIILNNNNILSKQDICHSKNQRVFH